MVPPARPQPSSDAAPPPARGPRLGVGSSGDLRASRAPERRRRIAYVGLALATIGVGLTVHLGGRALPPALRDVAGDALWAAMIACWVGAVAPTSGLRTRAAVAVCVGVELSQRVHAPTLDAVRATRLGHLVLGSDYDPRDLVAYAAGIAVVAGVERGIAARRRRWGAHARARA